VVVDNIDPLRRGRLRAQVPAVDPVEPTGWALPCLPFAGAQSGFYAVPAIGSQVWVEFEQGDPSRPIWVGSFWGADDEVPGTAAPGAPGVQQILLQTTGQNALMISDTPGQAGGILLKSSSGAVVSVSDHGIVISNGKGATVTMVGPAVTVNGGALEVV
jgi:uncharacterized protein involved in type VI secretion and phage assembly